MSIRVACSSCDFADDVPDEFEGKRLKCRQCGSPLIFGNKTPDKRAETAKQQQQPGTRDVTISCPSCAACYAVDVSLAGKRVKCRACQEYLRVPDPPAFSPQYDTSEPAPVNTWPPSAKVEEPPSPKAATPRARRFLASLIGSTALSSLALIVSLAALARSFLHDPLGSGLSKYDLTSPKACLISELKIEQAQDVRAELQLAQLRRGPKKIAERLKTLEVRKETEWNGKKILFISFEENGIKHYDVRGFEKDAESGLWMPSHVDAFTVGRDNRPLADQMEKWERAGQL